MRIARLTDTTFEITANFAAGLSGGIEGLSPTLRIRSAPFPSLYLDFNDGVFRTSAWVDRDADMTEVGDGTYHYALDLTAVTGLLAGAAIVAEIHQASVELNADVSEGIAIEQVQFVPLLFSLSDSSGGVTGLTVMVAIRLGGTPDSYLDFDDLEFKTSAWVTRQASMTEVNRGHYSRVLDITTIVPNLPDGSTIVAEFEASNGVVSTDTIQLYTPVLVLADLETPATPSYGITLAQRIAWLTSVIPADGTIELALFTEIPAINGTGAVEADIDRVTITSWNTRIVNQNLAERSNSAEVRFATLAASVTLAGWGLYNGTGTLVAFGRLRSEGGSPRLVTLAAGDTPVFGAGDLRVIA